MNQRKLFYTAEDVAQIMGVCRGTAYKVIKEINQDLSGQGKTVVKGKVSRKALKERFNL